MGLSGNEPFPLLPSLSITHGEEEKDGKSPIYCLISPGPAAGMPITNKHTGRSQSTNSKARELKMLMVFRASRENPVFLTYKGRIFLGPLYKNKSTLFPL
jgi:hypothetical protein